MRKKKKENVIFTLCHRKQSQQERRNLQNNKSMTQICQMIGKKPESRNNTAFNFSNTCECYNSVRNYQEQSSYLHYPISGQ